MRKLIAAVALVAAIVVSRGASAATFDVYAKETAPGSGQWALTVNIAGNEGLAALNILFGNVSGMVVNPLATGISAGDTQFLTDVGIPGLTGAIISGAAGAGGTSLPIISGPMSPPPPASYGFLLATLTAAGAGPIQLLPGEFQDTFAGTTFIAPSGAVSAAYTLTVVPEPTVALLLGMGLAGLALARRKA
jgi:hypothetical protein